MPDLAWAALVVFGGYVVLGLTGFGSALVIVPLLTWQWPLPHVVALTLLLDLPACMLHSILNLKQVRWGEIKRMLPGMLLGSAAGLWLMHVLEPRWPLLMLGVYVSFMGMDQLRRTDLQPRNFPMFASALAGGVAGAVEMMFGSAGPVLMTWLRLRVSNVMHLRATAPALIVCSAFVVLGEMAVAEKLENPELWHHWLWLISAALLGTAAGDRMASRVPKVWLTRVMATVLMISGLFLVKRFFHQ